MAKSRSTFNIFLCGILVVGLVYSTCIGLRNVFRYNTFKKEVVMKQSALAELHYTNQYYKRLVSSIKSDSFWIVEAKQKLGYSQKGEIVYKFYK